MEIFILFAWIAGQPHPATAHLTSNACWADAAHYMATIPNLQAAECRTAMMATPIASVPTTRPQPNPFY
jgi:hypothetical protein